MLRAAMNLCWSHVYRYRRLRDTNFDWYRMKDKVIIWNFLSKCVVLLLRIRDDKMYEAKKRQKLKVYGS